MTTKRRTKTKVAAAPAAASPGEEPQSPPVKFLFVVESPGKIKALQRILGDSYRILASKGHVMDLPRSRLAVEVENDFKADFNVIPAKKTVVKELKFFAGKAEKVFLAPDPDREGEAIAWHLFQLLGGDESKLRRVTYQEITPEAVRNALKQDGKIDSHKVNAQEARRVLDRIMGYKLSPLLWKKVGRGLSAGRVQSVALLLICLREDEIEAFKPEEYWEIEAHLEKQPGPGGFKARLEKIDGKKARIPDQAGAERARAELESAVFRVEDIRERTSSRPPPPPFITSQLQVEAARRFRWTVARTMKVAQRLYEGVELGEKGAVGLITYMRTDSYHLAPAALDKIREFIKTAIGPDYLPPQPRHYRAKKSQEGHEAIRPTDVDLTPEKIKAFLSAEQFQLYSLIWKRAVASQMVSARIGSVTVEVNAGRYGFFARREKVLFPGYLKVYQGEKDQAPTGDEFPPLAKEEVLKLLDLGLEQKFTNPPPRYTEGTLVKALEANGVGRPSTYVPIISTLRQRDYVQSEQGKLSPTSLGRTVNRLLQEHFAELINVNFTAGLEKELDGIESGTMDREKVLRDFYVPFEATLARAEKGMQNLKATITPTDLKCPRCGKPMVIRWGRRGEFLACTDYPACRHTGQFRRMENGKIEAVPEEVSDQKCPKCGSPMTVKNGRFGRFLACTRYPECKHTMALPTGVKCPQDGCDGQLVRRRSARGRTFYGCSKYPECKHVVWKLPKEKEPAASAAPGSEGDAA